MAYSFMKESGNTKKYVSELVADSLSDIDNLPTNCRAGSTCFCIENLSVYILNNSNEWVKI
jgi:hypothetical protein